MASALTRGGGYAAAAAAAGGSGGLSAHASPMVVKLEPASASSFAGHNVDVPSPGVVSLGKRPLDATRSASPYMAPVELECEGTDCCVRLRAALGCAACRVCARQASSTAPMRYGLNAQPLWL